MGILLFFILLFLLLGALFIAGVINLLKGHRTNNKSSTKNGLIFIAIPLIILIGLYINQNGFNFPRKPTQSALAGVYYISGAVSLLPADTYRQYSLDIKHDGRFYCSPPTLFPICEKGKYIIDDKDDIYQLTLYCNDTTHTASIKKKSGKYEIEFYIGAPNSGQKIIFSKQ